MKKFNRVLAMLLALVTVLAVLPISALADDWLSVDADKTTVENVTSTDITVTVDPQALLAYLQDGDIKGLLKGVSASGSLGDILTKEEILAIIPEEQIIALVKAIIADIDVRELIGCLDVYKFLDCVDKQALISILKGMDLQSYVKDGAIEVVMGYINDEDIKKAVDYLDTDMLINDKSDVLMDLALELPTEVLIDLVDVNAAIDSLTCIDLVGAAKLDYIETEIGYVALANKYVDKDALAAFVDQKQANNDQFLSKILDQVNNDALSAMLQGAGIAEKLEVYIVDLAKAESIVRSAYDAGAFDGVDLVAYFDGVTFNVNAMLADGILADLYADFLEQDIFDVNAMIFGETPLFEDLGDLISEGVLDAEALLDPANAIISFNDLVNNDIVSVDTLIDDLLAAGHTYEDLADFDVIEEQITASINENKLSADDILDCLKEDVDYADIFDIILEDADLGIDAIVETLGGYVALVEYVDVVSYAKAYAKDLGVKGIANLALDIIQNGDYAKIIDVEKVKAYIKGLNAQDVRAILATVDYVQVAEVLYESGIAQTLLDQLDLEAYLLRLIGIYNTIATTVTEIKINGDAITVQNANTDAIQLSPQKLFEALENMLPSIKELANIDESGKLFSTSIAISYYESDAADAEIVTKEITFNFALASGADLIRNTAAKISYMLDKFGYIGLAEGKLVVDVNIPDEVASVLRYALNDLGDSNSALADSLKDKILAIYTQNPDDFVAFAKGLTMDEIIAVLEAVDPELFGKAYNRVLASRYAKVLLSLVERFTGYDFSDNLEAQNLVNTLATIPTFEVFVEKLENVTGKEISDRLPAKVNGYYDNTVYDVVDKLGEVAGYDFDMQNLLKQAAASTDPFAYLYTAAVNKVENVTFVYNFVKRNAVRVADRLLASQIGQKFADLTLMDFYAGDAKFVLLNKEVSYNVKAIISNKLMAALNAAAARVSAVAARKDMIAAEIDNIMNMVFADDSVVTTGVRVTFNVPNIYRATFVDENGKVIITTLLPTGVKLTEMVDNYNGLANFEGWRDVATNAIINKMPAKDITVQAVIKADEPTTEEVTTPEVTEPTPEVTTPEVIEPEEPKVTIKGVEVSINRDDVNKLYTVTVNADWDAEGLDKIRFNLPVALLKDLANIGGYSMILTSNTSKHNVVLNAAMLNKLATDAAEKETVGFNYASKGVSIYEGLNFKTAKAYDFYFDFDDAIQNTYTFGADATVVITVPFAGVENNDYQKTVVYANGVADVEVTASGAESVTFVAKHFSNFTLVNLYLFTIENDKIYVNGNAIDKVIATLYETNNATINGQYFEAGTQISVTLDVTGLAGYKYVKTVFEGASLVLTAAGTDTFVMPNNAVTVKHVAEAIEYYYVYYYVNGNKVGEYKYSADVAANDVVNAVLGFDLSNYPAVVGDGWSWYGSADLANKLYGDPINLFRVHEEQTQITISFAGQANVGGTYKLNELNQNVFAQLKSNIDAVQPGYVWTANGKTLTDYIEAADYTALIEAALLNAGVVTFQGVLANEYYHVYAGDDVTVEYTNDGIKITVPNKEGYTVKIKFFDANGNLKQEVAGAEVTIGTLTYDLYVTVEYTAISVNYLYITIDVPAGSVLNATDITTLASAPADLVLYDVERADDGSLKLTYRYTQTEGFDEAEFRKDVNALISAVQYTTSWIVNGVTYSSEEEARAAELPEGAEIVGWEQMSEYVMVAIIEYTAPEGTSVWVVVCIVLVVLLFLALIVLVYVLHVTDKLQASWLTKVCVAIVGAFFAFCMILAKFTLKVLAFVGIKKEDILEELPEEEPVEDIPAVIHEPEAVAEEEVAEETAEEATEEVAEEVTEEAVEETVAEEVATEEEAVEEAVVEETAEEAAEEVVEEATEEATEEVVEETVAEEVATEEEAVEEAVVEETAEEVVEEVVEEATEETSEEN